MEGLVTNLQFIDYVILALLAFAGVIGAIKGFLKQISVIVGVVVTFVLTAVLSKYLEKLFATFLSDQSASGTLSLILSFVLIGLVVALILKAIQHKIQSVKGMKLLDVVLGFVLWAGVIYVLIGVASTLGTVVTTADESVEIPIVSKLLGKLFDGIFGNSYFAQHFYLERGLIRWLTSLLFGV